MCSFLYLLSIFGFIAQIPDGLLNKVQNICELLLNYTNLKLSF